MVLLPGAASTSRRRNRLKGIKMDGDELRDIYSGIQEPPLFYGIFRDRMGRVEKNFFAVTQWVITQWLVLLLLLQYPLRKLQRLVSSKKHSKIKGYRGLQCSAVALNFAT